MDTCLLHLSLGRELLAAAGQPVRAAAGDCVGASSQGTSRTYRRGSASAADWGRVGRR